MTVYVLSGVRPKIAEDVWIAPNASVIGDVRLRRGASVWFGAVLRGDNEPIDIGEDTNVQDMVMIHNDLGIPVVVGPGCTIGHKAILHGCTIGESSLIGMGAAILNRARIGRFCIVGANAVVSEGKEIPDYSLVVGIPGRVVRTFGSEIEAQLRDACASYVEKRRRYARDFAAV